MTSRRLRRKLCSVSPVVAVSTATPSMSFEKMEEGFGYEFVNAIVGGVIPRITSRPSTRAFRRR